jgi:hypothetical protein
LFSSKDISIFPSGCQMSLASQLRGSESVPPEMRTGSMGELTLGRDGYNLFAEASAAYNGTSEKSETRKETSVKISQLGESTIHESAMIKRSTSSSAGHCLAFSSFPSLGVSRTTGDGPSTKSSIVEPDINRTEDATTARKRPECFTTSTDANQQSQAIEDSRHSSSTTALDSGGNTLAAPAASRSVWKDHQETKSTLSTNSALGADSAHDLRASTSPTNQESVMEILKSDLQKQMSAAFCLMQAESEAKLKKELEAERLLKTESEAKFKAELEADRAKYRLDVKFGCEGELRNLSAQMMKTALQQQCLKLNSTTRGANSEYVGNLATKQSQSDQQKILAQQHSLDPEEFAQKIDKAILVRNSHTHFDNQISLLQCVLKFQIFLSRHDYLLEDPDVGFLATVIMKYDDWQAIYPKKLAPSPSAAHKVLLHKVEIGAKTL